MSIVINHWIRIVKIDKNRFFRMQEWKHQKIAEPSSFDVFSQPSE